MPLSEHEERVLAEIERQLADEDPRFVARARRTRTPHGPARLRLALAGFVLGLVCLLGLVVHFVFGLIGFAVMFTSVVVAVPELQRRRTAHPRSDADAPF